MAPPRLDRNCRDLAGGRVVRGYHATAYTHRHKPRSASRIEWPREAFQASRQTAQLAPLRLERIVRPCGCSACRGLGDERSLSRFVAANRPLALREWAYLNQLIWDALREES